ncbi:hypothetical protein NHJ6243_009579 [Beauveria neobassiana]
MSTNTAPAFNELEAAAQAVIAALKTMPEFSGAKILVIGGLGLWKYLRQYRTTEDVDFLITVQGAPKAVKDKLLAMPSSPFQQRAQDFVFKAPNGKQIQIDMTPDWQSPYVPPTAIPISDVQPGFLPYISELDLLVFKINCCGLRPTAVKKIRDANDARTLLEDIRSHRIFNRPPHDDFVTEQMDMHLVWTAGRVFLKPIPRFLLKPGFWTVYLVCADGRRQILRQRALGFLYSYAALLSHESDFRIAKDEYLLPPEVLWSARRILVEQLDMERVYPNVDRRFIHGELRLSRLNKLYSLYKTPLRGYMARCDQYGSFFHDCFVWASDCSLACYT